MISDKFIYYNIFELFCSILFFEDYNVKVLYKLIYYDEYHVIFFFYC